MAGKIAEDWGIRDGVRINNVHNFKGGEEKVIVLDCVKARIKRSCPMAPSMISGRRRLVPSV